MNLKWGPPRGRRAEGQPRVGPPNPRGRPRAGPPTPREPRWKKLYTIVVVTAAAAATG